jgi:3-isopropylmalate/(R)-2-methylmalate dehydratase large subunit
MQNTFFAKVWNDHRIVDLGDNTDLLQMDRILLHDQGGTALRKLRKSGRPAASPAQVFTVIDHVVETRPGRGPSESPLVGGSDMIRSMREMSREYGFTCFDIGDPSQGIIHIVASEQAIALPGLSVACADSHVCTLGGLGAIAFALSAGDGEHILATQTLPVKRPKTMRVTIEGRIAQGVSAKDIALCLIGQIGANGGIGYAVEFDGSAVRAMPTEQRLTLCNMSIDFSAMTGFIAPDDDTFQYIAGRPYAPRGSAWDRALNYWRALPSDAGAVFNREVCIDVSNLAPQVTWGTSLDHVAAIDGLVPAPSANADSANRLIHQRALDYIGLTPGTRMSDVPVDAVYIGSCTNSRLSDLKSAAAILKGRKIAPGLQAICVPGSTSVKRAAESEGLDKIFRDAGFEWHESGCGLCSGDGRLTFAGKRVVSTTNRNFEGRQGPGTKTHLASPATVAASAISGHLADARQFPTG